MSFAISHNHFSGLGFKLTAGNLLAFLAAAAVAFGMLDGVLTHYLRGEADQALTTQALDMGATISTAWRENDAVALNREIERLALTRGIDTTLIRVWDRKGKPVGTSDRSHWPGLAASPLPVDLNDDQIFNWSNWKSKDHPFGVRILTFNSPSGFILQIAEDQKGRRRINQELRQFTAFAFLGLLAFGTLFGWFTTRFMLRGVKKLEATAQRMATGGQLNERVTLPTGSHETDRVGLVLNRLLDRIDRMISAQKTVMDNIAHDVRSPVARMRASAETVLMENESEWAGKILGECDYILQLMDTLLEISAAEAGIPNWESECGDPSMALEEAMDLFEPVMEQKGLTHELKLEKGLQVEFNAKVWQRVVANLIDNAIKFSRPEGKICLHLKKENKTAHVTIADNGKGIAAKDLPYIFERFHRGDSSRTTRGSGLGLSFCKASIEAMGGTIHCESLRGEGTRFHIYLPCDQPPPAITGQKKPQGKLAGPPAH